MNIWLIMSGEPLEMFDERPHRIGILSKMLVKRGHNVTWWTTNYDHQHKKYFFKKDTKLKNNFEIDMIFLHPRNSYKKNVSFQRLLNYKQVSLKFKKLSSNEDKPDIILCAFPSIDLAYEAIRYGKKNDIPVIIDVRDMWPDVFLELGPKILRPIIHILLKPLFNKTKLIFSNAYSIIGMTDEFIKFGLEYGNRKKTSLDIAFPFGYPEFKLTEEIEIKSKNRLEEGGIDFNKFIVCYFGTIGKQFDFKPVIECAKKLNNEHIQIAICGKGDYLEELKSITNDVGNIVFPGWINQSDIWTLMKYSKVALAPYKNSKDFLSSLSNKSIEYLGGGLPILSSIEGVLGQLITKNRCGFVYGNSSNKLADYILLFKSNRELYGKMSKNALELFYKNYSANKVYNDMIEYLETICKNKEKNENT